MEYKVRLVQDDTYEVYSYGEETSEDISHFQGSLADCEAWIRLTEAGRLGQ
jgi:hypothetical protein